MLIALHKNARTTPAVRAEIAASAEPEPGFVEAGWFKSGRHNGGLTGEVPVVVCLSLCGRDVSDGSEQPVMVEPGHPFEGGQLQGFLGFPWRLAMDQLGLVQAIDRLGQGIVVRVSFAAIAVVQFFELNAPKRSLELALNSA